MNFNSTKFRAYNKLGKFLKETTDNDKNINVNHALRSSLANSIGRIVINGDVDMDLLDAISILHPGSIEDGEVFTNEEDEIMMEFEKIFVQPKYAPIVEFISNAINNML